MKTCLAVLEAGQTDKSQLAPGEQPGKKTGNHPVSHLSSSHEEEVKGAFCYFWLKVLDKPISNAKCFWPLLASLSDVLP